MKRILGPLDKRKKTSRCQACAKRRIKCEGGEPCVYCTRTGKVCQQQPVEETAVRFVVARAAAPATSSSLPAQIIKQADIVYLDYFKTFIQRFNITLDFGSVGDDLVPLVGNSVALRHVAVAIGALEASRRGSITPPGRQSPRLVAFTAYGSSIQALQRQISTDKLAYGEDMLWGTFLLGVFERMTREAYLQLLAGTSADGWAKHMVSGTSYLLQLSGPDQPMPSLRQKLFDGFRVLEVYRSVLYGVPTFLSQQPWLDVYHQGTPQCDDAEENRPLEAMLQLLLRASSFALRIEQTPEAFRPHDPVLDTIAIEGLELEQEMIRWLDYSPYGRAVESPCLRVTIINWHATRLFHHLNFSYYSCWEFRTIPMLQQYEIDLHVNSILQESDTVISDGIIPGIMLLFPLRMAGACATDNLVVQKIMGILGRVHHTGFIVSDLIKADIQALWMHKLFLNQGGGAADDMWTKSTSSMSGSF
ncbi:hypothetical protein ANO11243_028720 [Dothideomycetidae sp. 11243]|nr:hypothetical protein ANO11243_028720 [fungal sp. No.11243]